MREDAKPYEVFDGISKMVREIAKALKKWYHEWKIQEILNLKFFNDYNIIFILMERLHNNG